ncbi:MAG TPA: CdaR family protein [Lachnospiraceae bacterium]|nr:CdaR family protein [Lachnospiraceae bacterium]
MKKKTNITKKLLNNWALKLFSVVAAFLLWLLFMNIEDPEDQKSFYAIPVKLVNTDILEREGMVYDILDKTDTVRTVLVTAPKSVRDELSSSDIVAEADFSNLTVADTVEIQFYSLRYNDRISDIKGSNEILKLNIEDKKTKRLILSVETTGKVGEGYAISDVSPDQNRIEVSGPESIISKLASAKVTVDVTDSTSNISTYSDVVLYDTEGNILVADNLSMNTEAVRVKVEVLATKTVPISYTVMGVPAEGYMFTGEITSSPDTVSIAGATEILNTISQITVGEETLNITGQAEDMITIINIEDYLPEGIILVGDNSKGKVIVTTHIEKQQTKELHISSENINFLNMPAGYTVTIEEDTAVHILTIKGLRSDLDPIDQNTLLAHVNMIDFMQKNNMDTLATGVYETEVTFDFSDRIQITHPLRVQIRITKTEET